jgi:uncharacterized protein YukE
MNYFETINKGGVVLCVVCHKKITETGTALNDIPVHIECYHRESQVENRAKELYPIPVRGTYSEEAHCRTNRIAYTKGYMDALRVNQGTTQTERSGEDVGVLSTAVSALISGLSEDKSEGSYYYSWQANIAMAFKDEYERFNPNMRDGNREILHRIANNAAKNFLDLLIKSTKAPNVQVSDTSEVESELQTPATNTPTTEASGEEVAVDEMDKAVVALSLELPAEIVADVAKKWRAAKEYLKSIGQ